MASEVLIKSVDWQKVTDDLGPETADGGARRRWRNFRRNDGISELAMVACRPRRARNQVARKLANTRRTRRACEDQGCAESETDANLEESKADGKCGNLATESVHKPEDAEVKWIEFGADEA